jgi:hypothetical protein
MALGSFKIGLTKWRWACASRPDLGRGAARRRLRGPPTRLCTGAELVESETALRLGLVDELVAVEQVVPRARGWVETQLTLPPQTLLHTRELCAAGSSRRPSSACTRASSSASSDRVVRRRGAGRAARGRGEAGREEEVARAKNRAPVRSLATAGASAASGARARTLTEPGYRRKLGAPESSSSKSTPCRRFSSAWSDGPRGTRRTTIQRVPELRVQHARGILDLPREQAHVRVVALRVRALAELRVERPAT